MNITINTDASFCPDTLVGGYAFWITTDLGRYKRYGSIKDTSRDSTEAEMKAIANALYYLNTLNFVNIDSIYINTDSMCAIDYIQGGIQNLHGKSILTKYIIKMMYDIVRKSNINLNRTNLLSIFKLRHVKAHHYTGSTRSYVNDWCDLHAKMCMKEKRNNL